jgi:hypothetical protein
MFPTRNKIINFFVGEKEVMKRFFFHLRADDSPFLECYQVKNDFFFIGT